MSDMGNDVKAALAFELTKMKMKHLYDRLEAGAFNTDLWIKHYHESLEGIRLSEKEYAKQKPSVFD